MFWGGGTAPEPDPVPGGEGTRTRYPRHTPSLFGDTRISLQ